MWLTTELSIELAKCQLASESCYNTLCQYIDSDTAYDWQGVADKEIRLSDSSSSVVIQTDKVLAADMFVCTETRAKSWQQN